MPWVASSALRDSTLLKRGPLRSTPGLETYQMVILKSVCCALLVRRLKNQTRPVAHIIPQGERRTAWRAKLDRTTMPPLACPRLRAEIVPLEA